jgi:hypothetical protein
VFAGLSCNTIIISRHEESPKEGGFAILGASVNWIRQDKEGTVAITHARLLMQ